MPSERGPQRKTKAKVPKPPRGSGLNPSGEPATGQLHIPTEQPSMSQFNFDAHAPSGGVPTPISSGSTSFYGWNMQDADLDSRFPQGQFPHGQYYGASSSEDPFQGSSFESLPQGSSHNFPSSSTPLQGTGTSTSASEMTLIQRGEIPPTDVMHTMGPPRDTTRRTRRAMPPTPRMIPYPSTRLQGNSESLPSAVEDSTPQSVTSSTPQPTRIKLSDDIIGQSIKTAMQLVTRELFGEKAMAIDKAAKKIMLNKVIWDSVPRCFAPNATFENFITIKHRNDVANALSSTRGKFADYVRKGVLHAYRLFPPLHITAPAVLYRKCLIDKITKDGDGLAFMHVYSFNQVEIKAKFQNTFIMTNVIYFVWHGMHQEFLGETEEQQIENLKFMWALASTATFCSLDGQYEVPVKVDNFGGMGSNRKFLYILSAMNNLSGDERVQFHNFLRLVDSPMAHALWRMTSSLISSLYDSQVPGQRVDVCDSPTWSSVSPSHCEAQTEESAVVFAR
ncbi:uncharacterized protein F5147DRAFT_657355 [Suillus discolor]|uniref:Uncharacterized protein n=1 Tax=Suillus discolor TaxID=1912936 RepID=A0A9P7JNV9_9AGAM|nr:uncharacterized protein F5147DRAFT_657355 [Suillus discolor]KAG2093733.1 hypothetical protein F5147DRAFT_657355 [Suillus discolor]